ncbi:TetR/AcrR family transcriptional regulator [bacterium]|nr:TetR/AcrR family transcriptional regulator [bacterium]
MEAPPSKPTADALPARERILNAAAQLYAVRGFEGTSMRDIAEAAGVTKPLIFYHFASKERLYASLLEEALAACRSGGEAILSEPMSATERLHRFLASHVQVLRERPAVFAFAHNLLTVAYELPLGFDYRAEGRALFDQIVRVVEEGQAQGEFRRADPEAVAVLALASLGMYAQALLIGEIAALPEALEEHLLDLLLHGIKEPAA